MNKYLRKQFAIVLCVSISCIIVILLTYWTSTFDVINCWKGLIPVNITMLSLTVCFWVMWIKEYIKYKRLQEIIFVKCKCGGACSKGKHPFLFFTKNVVISKKKFISLYCKSLIKKIISCHDGRLLLIAIMIG